MDQHPPPVALDTAKSLIDFSTFGSKPRGTSAAAQRGKRLKEDLILYRALDAEEHRKQDRRAWRKPHTFSICGSDRVTNLSANVSEARAIMDGTAGADHHHGGDAVPLDAGPRGILKAISHATATPFVPSSEKEKEREREALAASLNQQQQQQANDDGTEQQQQQPPQSQAQKKQQQQSNATTLLQDASASDDPTAHIISEQEVREMRKKFKEMVRRQREQEAAAEEQMFADLRQQQQQHQQQKGASPRYHSADKKRTAARPAVARAAAGEAATGSEPVAPAQHPKKQQHQHASPSRATTSLAELTHAAGSCNSGGSGNGNIARFYVVEPPRTPREGQRASRARVDQFNAYRAAGVAGLQRPATAAASSLPARRYALPSDAHNSSASAVGNDDGPDSVSVRHRHAEDGEDDVARDHSGESARRAASGGVSAHPSLARDAASTMFRRAYEVGVALDARSASIREEEAAATAAIGSARRGLQQHQQRQQQQQQADPVIETTDPFQFLVDGAQAIHAGSRRIAASKREYTLSLQERLLSLAAAHAGVSLQAASAPGRVLGVRPPTAEAQAAHCRREASAVARRRKPQRSEAAAAGDLDESLFSAASTEHSAAGTAAHKNSPRVVAAVSSLNASLASARSAKAKPHPSPRGNSAGGGAFSAAAPLPFGRAGPLERHVPAVRICAATNERQQRSLCDNVHAASRGPSCQSYRPHPWPTDNGRVTSIRGAANAGLAAKVALW